MSLSLLQEGEQGGIVGEALRAFLDERTQHSANEVAYGSEWYC
jgi:hypothetical protein